MTGLRFCCCRRARLRFPAAAPPRLAMGCPGASASGQPVTCAARNQGGQPVLAYRWDFGDGTSASGASITHTWTEPGTYRIALEATALDGSQAAQHADIRISGHLSTVFSPAKIRRLEEPQP